MQTLPHAASRTHQCRQMSIVTAPHVAAATQSVVQIYGRIATHRRPSSSLALTACGRYLRSDESSSATICRRPSGNAFDRDQATTACAPAEAQRGFARYDHQIW